MDRLLSGDDKIMLTNDDHTADDYVLALLKAQLAKADKEWVEWVERIRTHMGCGGKEYIAIPLTEWQERKKEIGI